MKKTQQLSEGKAKKVYATDVEGIYYYCEQEKEFLLPQEGLTEFVERG